MNVECQTIEVPTGVQDYRPALYGGIAAIELGVDGIRRVAARRRPARARAAHRARLHRRAAQLGHQQLGDHQAAHRRRPPRLRLLRAHPRHRRRRCARRSSAATGTRSAGRSPIEWDNRKRLAPGVTTPAIDDADRAARTAAGATAAKVCGAGGGGCLFCYGPPDARAGDRRRRSPPAAPRCSTTTIETRRPAALDNLAIARVLARDRRPARDQGREPVQDPRVPQRRRHRRHTSREPVATLTPAERLRDSRHRQGPRRARSARSPRPATAAITGSCSPSFRRRSSTCCTCRASGRRPSRTLYRELDIRTLDDLEQAARDGRIRALQGMGAKKEALILKALEERQRYAGRHLLAEAHDAVGGARRVPARARARRRRSSPVGSLRRGCETCGDLDILAAGAPTRR